MTCRRGGIGQPRPSLPSRPFAGWVTPVAELPRANQRAMQCFQKSLMTCVCCGQCRGRSRVLSCLGKFTSNLDSCACTHQSSSLAWLLRIITTPLHRQLLAAGRQRQACKVGSMSRAHLGTIG